MSLSAETQAFAERIHQERARGRHRPLLQSEHRVVNAHFPGLTDEKCFICGEATGRAGKGDDSLYIEDEGPYCVPCWTEATEETP